MVQENGQAYNASRNGQGKPTRNAALRHAQSLGRQRQAAEVTPQHRATCAAAFIRKAVAEGQALDLTPHQLDDTAWSELVYLLSPEELAAVNAASGQSEPASEEPAPATPTVELPGWRSEHPKYVHSMEWHDFLGIKHMLVFRDDDLDTVLREARTIREFIKAARARDEKPAERGDMTTQVEAEPSIGEHQAWQESADDAPEEHMDALACPEHGMRKIKPSRYGGYYCAAKMINGQFCTFKTRRAAK